MTGTPGYDHLLRHVVPLLLASGLARTDIDRLLVANPRRALTVASPADVIEEAAP